MVKKIRKGKVRSLKLKGIGSHSPGTTVPRTVIAHGSQFRWKGRYKQEETTTTTS